MKRLAYIAPLSAMVVLVFAVIASAQDSTDQSTSYPNSAEQAQSQTPSEQAIPAQDTPTVIIRANAFDPAQLDVAPGTTVTFVNEDTVPHTVTLDGLFDPQEIPPGSSYPVWLGGSGTVTYHDETNPGMQGAITVGGASQGEATTPEQYAGEPPQSGGEPTQTTDASTQPSQAPAQI